MMQDGFEHEAYGACALFIVKQQLVKNNVNVMTYTNINAADVKIFYRRDEILNQFL